MREIRRLNYLEYLFGFSRCRSPLSDYYLDHCRETVNILGAFRQDGQEAGLILWAQERRKADLLYLYVLPGERNKGIGGALLDRAIHGDGKGDPPEQMRCRISAGGDSFPVWKKLLESRHFFLDREMKIFQADMNRYPVWERYMEKHGKQLDWYLREEGFTPVSFQEAPLWAVEEIQHPGETGFDTSLDPVSILMGKKGDFRRDLSFLSLRDGRVASYCLVSQPDSTSIVYEIFSSARDYQYTGVILQPFLMSMNVLKNAGISRIGFAVYQDNGKALALTRRLMRGLISHTETQYHYQYKVRRDQEI